ncbi:MAG TPA: glycoside hydrolase family 3 N-terminal domain-containing protein [Armatimonadota bacterium]|nr:glycoside hydrolase family 3 N-terminal domain-containing protein [Armatimonadota bacterium]
MKHFRLCGWAAILLALCSAAFADISLRDAKSTLANGTPVSFNGLSVTAQFTGQIYVEQTNRAQGIRVDTSKTFAQNTLVNVSGTIETDPLTDERYVAASAEYPQAAGGTFAVDPVTMINRSVTGGDLGLQKGIAGDLNLNNIGMLLTVCGRVSAFDDAYNPTNWFKISDPNGPEIKIVVPSGVRIRSYWEYVRVTGICSAEKVGGSMVRVLNARGTSDLAPYQPFVQNWLANMTLDQKIGQLFQVRFDGDVFTQAMADVIQQKHIGGVIYFQYNGNLNDPTRSAQFSNDLQACAMGADGIPLFISMDQEGGRVTRITGGADFPGNMALGASRDTNLAYSAGSVFGSEIRAVGANMDLAPVLDVNNNPMNPVIGVRSFGEQPALAGSMGIAYLQGLHSNGVIATGKHFPGHGDTAVDSHSGLPIVTYDFNTLDTIHAEPFRQAINNGLDCIMTAHILVTCLDPNDPATLSPLVIDGYLRDELGFDGVCMTDSMGMAGITSGYGVAESSVMAIQAGVDLLSLSPDLDTAINAIRSAVQGGQIPMSRIDQAVTRTLSLKYRRGLFDNPYCDPNLAAGIVGSTEHWNAELEAARYGATLVQNTAGFLPLNLTSGQKILLVTVQSSETTTDAAARFASYITAKHSNTASMSMTANPTSSQRTTIKNAAASAYMVIVGTSRAQISNNVGQATLVNDLVTMGKPVVVVGLREPYELASFPGVNAYLAAYNYRNCGFAAAADILFGDWNPSGLLPVTIPGYYSYGYGLHY